MTNRKYQKKIPKRQTCLVVGCLQNHPYHYCKDCYNQNSNHLARNCPNIKKIVKNVKRQNQLLNSRKIDQDKQQKNKNLLNRHLSQNPYKIKYQIQPKKKYQPTLQKQLPQHLRRQTCRVITCIQDHKRHYCDKCKQQNSDHTSENCKPFIKSRQRKYDYYSKAYGFH